MTTPTSDSGKKGFKSTRLLKIRWTIVGLTIVNVLLMVFFVIVLLGGPITGEIAKYITHRYLYAPPLIALLLSLSSFLFPAIKLILEPHLPKPRVQKELIKRILRRIIKFVPQRIPTATLLMSGLVLLAAAQIWAAENICEPAPTSPGHHGVVWLVLSDNERLLYVSDQGRGAISVYASGASSEINNSYQQIDEIVLANQSSKPMPEGMARTPDGRFLYVADGANGVINIIDLSTQKVLKSLSVGDSPRWVAVSPTGDRVYVSNVHSGVSVIDVATQVVTDEITGLGCPEGLAISADGQKLFVASQCGHDHDPLFIVDTVTHRIIAQVPGLAVGNAVLLSSDGKKAYVSRANMHWHDPVSGKDGSPISVIDVASHRIIKTLVLQISTDKLALSPDGKYLFVTNGYQLSTIDTQTDELVSNFSLRGFGASIVVRSDNTVIVGVADKRRFVMITLQKLLSRWPCSF